MSRQVTAPSTAARAAKVAMKAPLQTAEWRTLPAIPARGSLPLNTPTVTLEPEEIFRLTAYKTATRQLLELHRQGFHRARIGRSGSVVLERAHFEAVCRGEIQRQVEARPKVRPPARTAA